MRSIKTIYPFNSSSTSIQKTTDQEINYQQGRDAIAVRLAQSATALLVVICFLGLPIFWLQVMVRFSTVHLLNLQQQQMRKQNALNDKLCSVQENDNNKNSGSGIFEGTFGDFQNKENYQRYECDPWAQPMQL